MSKIQLSLAGGLKVITDRDKIAPRMKLLNLVISQQGFDAGTVNYIDLRFQEPIIGKKEEEKKKGAGK